MVFRLYSDPHWSDLRTIILERRPFSSPENMDDDMIRRWNAVVKDDDITIINGDLQVRKGRSLAKILRELNGIKWIIPGNHDDKFVYEYPFLCKIGEIDKDRVIILPDVFKLEKAWNGRDFVFCHFPMSEWEGMYDPKPSIHLYGHIHVKWSNDKPCVPKRIDERENCLNITLGYLAFRTALPAKLRWTPLTFDELMAAFNIVE